MSTPALLMTLTTIGVWALFLCLAGFLLRIAMTLEDVGGPGTRFRNPVNYLSKIRLGVRAIEVQTGAIVPQVTRLNESLRSIRGGLAAIAGNLDGVIEGVSAQPRGRS